MVTEIGKFLRVLRAKNLETAKEMAKKLNVSFLPYQSIQF